MDEAVIRALAGRFFDAIEAGDIESVAASYAPHAVIWHNTDEAESSREDNLTVLRGFVRGIPQRRYAQRRLVVFPGGFVQQHVLEAVRADGLAVTLPACIVCSVEGGAITRLDEYFNSARVAEFTRPAG